MQEPVTKLEADVDSIALRLLAEQAEDRLDQVAAAAIQAQQLARTLRTLPCREHFRPIKIK